MDEHKEHELYHGEWSGSLKNKKRKGILNFILNLFICSYCLDKCKCCKCRCCLKNSKDFNSNNSRHKIYSTLTFTFSWIYFVGAIFVVPFLAQMFLNSLATATAVTIFIKRKELFLQQYRTITGLFMPIIVFMSAYAVWSLRDDIDSDVVDETDVKLFGLAVLITVVNGVWIIASTLFISIIEDEIWFFDSYWITDGSKVNSNKDVHHISAKMKANSWFLGSYFVPRIYGRFSKDIKDGVMSAKEKYESMLDNLSLVFLFIHMVFGVVYIVLNVIFIRENEMFTLNLIIYIMCFVLGGITVMYMLLRQRFKKLHKKSLLDQKLLKERIKTRYGLQVTQVFSQLLILFLGISGSRILYALLGGLDFDNIFVLPVRIIAATFFCWFLLLYRTLEVIEWNVS